MAAPEKITRDDIESKFRQLTSDVDDRADAARSRGKKKTTVIEVRRF